MSHDRRRGTRPRADTARDAARTGAPDLDTALAVEAATTGRTPTRGYIIPVGGAEDKVGDAAILRRFAALCGGEAARIAIIPTASELQDTGEGYQALFTRFGAAEALVLPITSRAECERPDWLAVLDQVDGVFLTGGNQLRLSTMIGGTEIAKALRRRNAAGLHVAGTSAGASFLSEHMIAFGQEGSSPRARIVGLAPGLGLHREVIIDQHFRQRDRLGRLLTALAFNPYAIGIGLDEDTAAFIGPDDVLEVVGSGAITVVDPSDLDFSSMARVRKNDPVCLIGLRLHILDHGATFNLDTRVAAAAPLLASRV
ncbi:MAG TPA: cyanophycinase [Gemmatimonadales bacterium]|nr:cyanophycinase [Gemmatimonadales bacterium]